MTLDSHFRELRARGIEGMLTQASAYVALKHPFTPEWLKRRYWDIAERYQRRKYLRNADVSSYPNPPDPIEVTWIDPSRITEFTRRDWPPWKHKTTQFGRVKGGDWDIREEFSLRPGHPEPPRQLYFADRFEGLC